MDGRNSVRVALAFGIVGLLASFKTGDAHPVKTTLITNEQPSKCLILILNLILQLYFPNGLQQRPALLEARFAQVAQA